jgi:hypothetical protein
MNEGGASKQPGISLVQKPIQMIKVRNGSMSQDSRLFLFILVESFYFIQCMTANHKAMGDPIC